jgi:protein-S-isoprenylcysteine O-methyltransferase Ste14
MSAAPVLAERPTPALVRVLMQPWLDRTIAIVAALPFLYLSYLRYRRAGLGIPFISFAIGSMLTFLTMMLRRPPKRVTPNPWFWLLAFVATYWPVLTIGFIQKGQPIVPKLVSDGIAIASLVVIVWARLSLGRNIGFVPAQREIVTTGAYRYMRHPIYTGLFLGFLGVALRAYSLRNAVLLSLGILWFLIKSVVEERFLRADPQYAAYLAKVRARWIPFTV